MSLLQPEPPFKHISAETHISPRDALLQITTYLQNSEDPQYVYLHPDCTFDHRGPTRTVHAKSRGLVLHQLWRIGEGLDGKNLGEEAVLDDLGGNRAGANLDEGAVEQDAMELDVVQDEREQQEQLGKADGVAGEEIGEVEDSTNVVGEIQEVPEVKSSAKVKKRKAGTEESKVAKTKKSKKAVGDEVDQQPLSVKQSKTKEQAHSSHKDEAEAVESSKNDESEVQAKKTKKPTGPSSKAKATSITEAEPKASNETKSKKSGKGDSKERKKSSKKDRAQV